MKILFYSTMPYIGMGYGVLTKNLVPRMIGEGHAVKIATKHMLGAKLTYEGIECIDGTEIPLINQLIDEEGYDYLFSAMDTWALSKDILFKKWVAINFLDKEFIFPKMINNLKSSLFQIAVTEHGKRELERSGFKPFYAPLGVDTKLFAPDYELRKQFRAKRGWSSNTFVIGVVGINYQTDRKNIIGTIRAFQNFHTRHPNSKLYLHTDVTGSFTNGVPLLLVIKGCGFRDDSIGSVEYVNQKDYHLFDISQEYMADLYRAFDVFCLPSKGEGFGLPWLEAQASGCPIISANTTGGKQLNFGGYLIPAKDDYFKWSEHGTWFLDVPPSAIDEQLELAYLEWEDKLGYDRRGKVARSSALEYDWDAVYKRYWSPILKELENCR